MKMRSRKCPECGQRYATDTGHRTCYDWRCEQAAAAKERTAGADILEVTSDWQPIGGGCRKRINFRELDGEEREWEAHDE